jgi:hypothetical protein
MTPKSLFRTSAIATAFVLAASAGHAQACPEWQIGGQQISVTAAAAAMPQSFGASAGGQLNLSACAAVDGVGYLTAGPTFSLSYDSQGTNNPLDLSITSQNCDTVMLVNDATAQWHFNDDSDGSLNARITLPAAPSGRYDIWLGTYGPQSCAADLVVTSGSAGTPSTGPGADATCPDWSLGGAELQLAAGASDTRQVVAGGGVNLFERAQACGVQGHGYVAQAPDFTLYYDDASAAGELVVSVTADCDTVMLINDLNAEWLFNDDTNGLNPEIRIPTAASGRYDIWVGTYGPNLCQSSISLTSVMPAAPTPSPGLSK